MNNLKCKTGIANIQRLHLLRSVFAALLICAASQVSAQLLGGRVYTEPSKLYVNQPFQMVLELEIGRGLDIGNIRIQNFPNDPEYITLETLQQERARQNRRNESGEVFEILQFTAKARCHKALTHKFNPVLICEIIERRSRGFFSFSNSTVKQIALEPFTLSINQLPQAGKPDNFSGAIGTFELNASLSRQDVRPGDLITLTIDLKGDGWLNNTVAPLPPSSKFFKCYPPKEIMRTVNRLTVEQILIPVSTNAVNIEPAVFNYFNPQTERYESATSPEFKLNFLASDQSINTNEVMIIDAEQPQTQTFNNAITIKAGEVNRIIHKIMPLATACATILLASFIFLMVKRANKWIAGGAALLILICGGILTLKSSARQETMHLTVRQQSPLRLTPSGKAPVILTLPAKTVVSPREDYGNWIRVDTGSHSGWMTKSALQE